MAQPIDLICHKNFPAWTARATVQVRPGNDVVVANPSTLKTLLLFSLLSNLLTALDKLVNALDRVVGFFRRQHPTNGLIRASDC